ncbi:hypothetical protein ACU686_38060 [Yinghuangia aomiensis]
MLAPDAGGVALYAGSWSRRWIRRGCGATWRWCRKRPTSSPEPSARTSPTSTRPPPKPNSTARYAWSAAATWSPGSAATKPTFPTRRHCPQANGNSSRLPARSSPTARLVILDEATCHLDPATEALAERAFAARPGALVVIAHRMDSATARRPGPRSSTGRHPGGGDARGTDGPVWPLYADLTGHWQGVRTAR